MTIEKRLENALQRLIQRCPEHAVNKEQMAVGRLKISFSSVAREAGVSRTLVGFTGAAFPDIREQISNQIKLRREARDALKASDMAVTKRRAKTAETNHLAAEEILRLWFLANSRNPDGSTIVPKKSAHQRMAEVSLVQKKPRAI